MYYIELTWLLQALFLTVLAIIVLVAMRSMRRRGRLVLALFIVLCAVGNPGRGQHIRAILRGNAAVNEHRLRESAKYHDFLIASTVSVHDRLLSVGWLGGLFVASIPCTAFVAEQSVLASQRPVHPRF